MSTETSDRIMKTLRYGLPAIGAVFIVMYVAVALLRMRYPFELEWIEGSCADHVVRVLPGQQLYVPPSIDFTPFLYTPLYFYLSALAAKIIGVGFVPLRLVSFAASLGCFLVINLIAKKETGKIYYGVVAAGMFAATFIIGGQWFDIARPDTLFVFFALLSVYLLVLRPSPATFAAAGLSLVLSFFTKQSALVIAVPMLIASYFASKKYFLYFVGVVILGIGFGIWAFDRASDGWFSYYILRMPSQHYVLKGRLIYYWVQDLMYPLPIACALTLGFLYFMLKKETVRRGLFYLFVIVGFVVGAWTARFHSGAYLNVLLPVYAILSIGFALGLHKFLEFMGRDASSNLTRVFTAFLYVICLIQFGSLLYNPSFSIPKPYDVAAGNRLLTVLSEFDGEVYVPAHGYLPTLVGRRSHAHVTALHDITRAMHRDQVAAKLMQEIDDAIRSQRFSAIILDKGQYITDLEPYYIAKENIFDVKTDFVFWPVTGLPSRPETIYVPNTGKEDQVGQSERVEMERSLLHVPMEREAK